MLKRSVVYSLMYALTLVGFCLGLSVSTSAAAEEALGNISSSIFPGAASFKCTLPIHKRRGGAHHSYAELSNLNSWIDDAKRTKPDSKWAKDLDHLFEGLLAKVDRVKRAPDGSFVYAELTGESQDALDIDSEMFSIAGGLTEWALQPDTVFSRVAEKTRRLMIFQRVVGDALFFDRSYTSREGVTYKAWPDDETRSATYHGEPLFRLVADYFLPRPIYFYSADGADALRSKLGVAQDRAIAKLDRLENSEREFSRYRILQDAIDSLDRPELKLDLEKLKENDSVSIRAQLARDVARSLKRGTLVGSSRTVTPSGIRLGFLQTSETTRDPTVCGITLLEAKAIAAFSKVAQARANRYLNRRLRSDAVSVGDIAFGKSALCNLDAQDKELLRSFVNSLSGSLAERSAYEFFWVFRYRSTFDGRSISIAPIVEGNESPETLEAFEIAARTLEMISNSQIALKMDYSLNSRERGVRK